MPILAWFVSVIGLPERYLSSKFDYPALNEAAHFETVGYEYAASPYTLAKLSWMTIADWFEDTETLMYALCSNFLIFLMFSVFNMNDLSFILFKMGLCLPHTNRKVYHIKKSVFKTSQKND